MNSPRLYLPPKVERGGDVIIVTLTGSTIRDVEDYLAAELEFLTEELGSVHLLIDFANVTCVYSVELGTLIGLHKRLTASGGRLTLFNLSDDIYEVFATTRLDTLLAICREKPVAPFGPPRD